MNKEEMKNLYEVSVKRYNTLIDGINDTYTSMIYLEQFPVVVGSFVDDKSLDKVLELGNTINRLELSLKDVKKTIKEVVNNCIDEFDEDLTETSSVKMLDRMTFVGKEFTKEQVDEINAITDKNINVALDFAKSCDDADMAEKLAGYAAVMKVLINERNKDIEE